VIDLFNLGPDDSPEKVLPLKNARSNINIGHSKNMSDNITSFVTIANTDPTYHIGMFERKSTISTFNK
jgi:hypothetical protein